MPILVLDHCGARIPTSPRDHALPQLAKVIRSDRFREGELAGEDRRNANLAGFNVDIRGDNRSRGVVDSFALKEHKPPVHIVLAIDNIHGPSYASGTTLLFFPGLA